MQSGHSYVLLLLFLLQVCYNLFQKKIALKITIPSYILSIYSQKLPITNQVCLDIVIDE